MFDIRYSFEQIYGIVNGWANPYNFLLFDRFLLYSNYPSPYVVESTGQMSPVGTFDRFDLSSTRCHYRISLTGIRLLTALLAEICEGGMERSAAATVTRWIRKHEPHPVHRSRDRNIPT